MQALSCVQLSIVSHAAASFPSDGLLRHQPTVLCAAAVNAMHSKVLCEMTGQLPADMHILMIEFQLHIIGPYFLLEAFLFCRLLHLGNHDPCKTNF